MRNQNKMIIEPLYNDLAPRNGNTKEKDLRSPSPFSQ